MPQTTRSIEDRFWSHVDVRTSSSCWEWTACRNSCGYGVFSPTWKVQKRAHRMAYELLVGPIPEGLQIDHLCRNRACVNPNHLEPVTPRENTLRGETIAARHARATHCPERHPYSGDNLYVRPNGKRECRTCRAANR